jgi:hypothetical protein
MQQGVAGGGVPQAGVAAAGQVPQQLVVGARNPGRSNQARVLDYDQERDAKFYNKAIVKLDGDPYDDGKQLPTFLKTFGARAKQYGWMPNLVVPCGNPPVAKDILLYYGQIKREEVQTHALSYLGDGSRLDQNSDMIYNCLRVSLGPKVKDLVFADASRYTFEVRGERLEDGVCFLKSIIDKTRTNTLANVFRAKENLSSLKEYMQSLPDCSITTFNAYVKEQVEVLAAGGERTSELVTHLFKGYEACRDKKFQLLITNKKQAFFNHEYRIEENALDFMEMLEAYYKDQVTAGDWMLPDDNQNKILALQAEIAQMMKGFKHSKQSGRQNPKHNMGKKNANDREGWKLIPPKKGESWKKIVDGKTYHWCPNHNMWTIHPVAECRLGKGKEPVKKHTSKGKNQKGFALKAYQALMEDDEDEELSNDEAEQSEGEESRGSNTSE